MKKSTLVLPSIRIVPYGCGWEDIYLNIGDTSLYFSISTVEGSSIQQLLRLLYYLYPRQRDPIHADDLHYYYGIREKKGELLVVDRIVDRLSDEPLPYGFEEIPIKGSFEWSEEGAKSLWTIIRPPTYETEFPITLQITLLRDQTLHYTFSLSYKALCYAVAKACTQVIKTFGLFGYHQAVYEWDMNLRYLLFIKAIALDCLDTLSLSSKDGRPFASSLQNELQLLLAEMD
ncbi:MAG: hypothetical protein IJN80_01175 [Clostridia bacterium]|nr:hypothetical protein [Clostridia bacterium]